MVHSSIRMWNGLQKYEIINSPFKGNLRNDIYLLLGCYYQYQYYNEGEQIKTSEPCLNCTCHNQMLMCYLNVCPFIKPVGKNCVVEKREDQCCPTIMCPQGKNHFSLCIYQKDTFTFTENSSYPLQWLPLGQITLNYFWRTRVRKCDVTNQLGISVNENESSISKINIKSFSKYVRFPRKWFRYSQESKRW